MKKLLLVLFLIPIGLAFGQTSTFKGFVFDEKTQEPIYQAEVKVLGTDPIRGITTDENGYFSITKLPSGNFTVEITEFFHSKTSLDIKLKKGQMTQERIFLKESDDVIGTVDVSAEKADQKTKVHVSMIKVDKDDINQIPTIGGEADIATYFETVPGVVSTGDQGGQMYVRGGSPIQNKVLLDGMTIYNPFHSIGFFSVFDTEIIQSADIYTGGFSAEHGGRISSVMDIKTRDGKKTRTSGRISISPFGAKGLIEGPLKKAKTQDDGTVTYLLSGKTSYLEQSSKTLYKYVNDTAGLPFNYTDLYGKISINSRNGSQVKFFGFNFNDRVNYQGISNLKWNTFGLGTQFLLVPPGSPVLISGHTGFSKYNILFEEDNGNPDVANGIDSSAISNFNLGFDFKYFIKENELKYGLEVSFVGTEYSFFNSVGKQIEQVNNNTEFSAYVDYKIIAGRLIIEPSFRAQVYGSAPRKGSRFSPEPRLGGKFNFTENFRLKFAGGLYSQNVMSSVSDKEVVNLFGGYLAGSDNMPDTFTTQSGEEKEINSVLQKATHAIAGFEIDISDAVSINVEGYYKWFNQLSNINTNKLFEDNAENAQRPDELKTDFTIETGVAKGVDFVIKYRKNNLYLWGVYSLGKVDRWDGTEEYNPVFDRRHNVNLLGTFKFGKDETWEVNARWNFGSGLPFTPRGGYYHSIDFADGADTDITTANSSELSTVYGQRNSARLPTYHRLDLTIKKKFEFSEYSKLDVSAGVTNVYSRENLFYVIPEKNEVIYQLPFMPSMAVAWTF